VEVGRALVCGTSQGVYARVKAHPDKLVMTSDLNQGKRIHFECEMNQEKLRAIASEGEFWSYGCGVALEILTHFNVCVVSTTVD